MESDRTAPSATKPRWKPVFLTKIGRNFGKGSISDRTLPESGGDWRALSRRDRQNSGRVGVDLV